MRNENKVTKEECLDAIEYLFVEGFIEEMTSDKKWATKILLTKVANIYKLDLIWGDKQLISYEEYKKLRKTKWDDLSKEDKEKRLKEFERRISLAHKFFKKLVNKEYIAEDIANQIQDDDTELKDFVQYIRAIANEKKGES